MDEAATMYESLLRDSTDAERVRASAAVVPWRRVDGKLEVYWARRAATMPFMGGWWAFPGGGLSRRDAGVEVAGEPAGCSLSSHTPASPGLDQVDLERLGADLLPGLLVCALRELFEETGLWASAPGSAAPGAEELATARRQVLAKEVNLGELDARLGARLDAGQLVFAGRWLTPPFVPMRFDNRFFLLEWPADRAPQPSLEGGELDRGEWIEPARALERWRDGEVLAAPPILHILRVLAEDGPEDGLERLRDTAEADLGPMRRIEFLPGLVLLPLRTPTLPPATHTNAFLVGHRRAVLIDPAPHAQDEQARLLAALDAAREQGREVEAVWLSHHHPDHVGAADAVRKHLGVPVLAHEECAGRLRRRGLEIDGTLEDGQTVDLGDGLSITVHSTPGHTRGHLAFELVELRALIIGDLISTLSTIVIDPPEGDMDAYLRSLERMAALEPRVLLPSHGPLSLEAVGLLEKVRRHRLDREAQVLAACRDGHTSAEAIVSAVYTDVPSLLHPVARRQVQAHLERLRRLGEL